MLGYGILLMCMTACSHADITMKTDKVEFVEFYLSGTEADEPILFKNLMLLKSLGKFVY